MLDKVMKHLNWTSIRFPCLPIRTQSVSQIPLRIKSVMSSSTLFSSTSSSLLCSRGLSGWSHVLRHFSSATELQKVNRESSSSGKNVEKINFEDYRTVFKNKTSWELMRGLLILRLCSINFIVDNSLQVGYLH